MATELPGTVGAQLLDTARAAFTTGFNIVAVIGVVLLLGLALLALVAHRRIPPTGQEPALVAVDEPTDGRLTIQKSTQTQGEA